MQPYYCRHFLLQTLLIVGSVETCLIRSAIVAHESRRLTFQVLEETKLRCKSVGRQSEDYLSYRPSQVCQLVSLEWLIWFEHMGCQSHLLLMSIWQVSM